MSNEDLKKTLPSGATETPAGGMGQPNGAKPEGKAGSKPASPEELSATIELLMAQNKKLSAENAAFKQKLASNAPASADGALDRLAALLSEALEKKSAPERKGPSEEDPVNRASAYNTRNQVDGQSLMDAQAALIQFREERKEPVSVPKLLAAYIGPQLVVSVNGVRVSIPADGKTYYINATHALAARERMAKINRMQSKDPDNTIEIS